MITLSFVIWLNKYGGIISKGCGEEGELILAEWQRNGEQKNENWDNDDIGERKVSVIKEFEEDKDKKSCLLNNILSKFSLVKILSVSLKNDRITE